MRTVIVSCLIAVAASLCNAQWVHALDSVWVTSLAVSGTHLFAATGQRGVLCSTNNGNTWIEVNNGLPWSTHTVSSLAVSGSNLFAGAIQGIYHSSNGGTSWTEVSAPLPYPIEWSLAVSGTNVFAYSARSSGGVFLSSNNGVSWTAVNPSIADTAVTSLAVDGTSLLAGYGYGGIFFSTNNGTSWTAVNSGELAGSYVERVAVNGTNLFAATSMHGAGIRVVYVSSDSGINWIRVGSISYLACFVSYGADLLAGGIGIYRVGKIANDWVISFIGNIPPWQQWNRLAILDTSLFFGSDGGVWRRPLSEMITSVRPVANDLPREFSLQQNYPNPFNPVTNFQFTIPHSQLTILKVYDVLGREVATLVNEVKQPGTYTVQWDASGVTSGVYFCRLKAGDFVATRKLVLLE